MKLSFKCKVPKGGFKFIDHGKIISMECKKDKVTDLWIDHVIYEDGYESVSVSVRNYMSAPKLNL